MKIQSTALAGVFKIELDCFRDERGQFQERFNADKFRALGIPALPNSFVLDQFSVSQPGVMRGLHFQEGDAAQAKIVGVTAGKIWDVVLDLRSGSPTFGQHLAIELSAERPELIFIPEGFAHGFCVLGPEPAHVTYKASRPYAREREGGINALDPALKIAWPLREPLRSAKDRTLPLLQDYAQKSR